MAIVPYQEPSIPFIENSWTVNAVVLFEAATLFFYFIAISKSIDLADIILKTLSITLGKPIKERPGRYFRLFYAKSLFVFYLTSTIFSAKLASIWISPDTCKVKTISEFVRKGYRVKAFKKYVDIIMETLDKKMALVLRSRVDFVDEQKQFAEMMKCENVSWIAKQSLVNRLLRSRKVKCFTVVEESLVPSPVGYITTYGSPFLKRFNVIIESCFESGLLQHWTGDMKDTNEIDTHIMDIDLLFLYPVLKLYVLLMITAFVIFLAETIYYKYRNNK